MSKTMRQLIPSKRNKAVKKLSNHAGKKKVLLKNCSTKKKKPAHKKEISCLKRYNANLKLQLQEQKLENASLSRKCLHLESETHRLQAANTTLKEENRYYEKLVNNAEPDIRSCMTHLVETSQTLANLQMAINRNRSRQQLSKIGGSLSKLKPHIPTAKSTQIKHSKSPSSTVPRRKQLVRPMVQGLTLFTNLTIPLQRVTLPTQNTRTHIQVPVVEAPQEAETLNIAVEPEASGSVVYKRRRRSLHYVKSKPKRFVMKTEADARHAKKYVETEVHFCADGNCEPAESSESETDVKNYLKPIVLIRDFNMPCPKSKQKTTLANCLTESNTEKSVSKPAGGIKIEDNPLEGTSKMFLDSAPSTCSTSECQTKPQVSCSGEPVNACKEEVDSDSDCDSKTNCDTISGTLDSESILQSSIDACGVSNHRTLRASLSETAAELTDNVIDVSRAVDNGIIGNLEPAEGSRSLLMEENNGENNETVENMEMVQDDDENYLLDNMSV